MNFMNVKSTDSNLNLSNKLINTLTEGFTGIKNELKEIGTDVKRLAEERRKSSSQLATSPQNPEQKDEEIGGLIQQLLVNSRIYGDVLVRDDSKKNSITLDIETGIKKGKSLDPYGLEVYIDSDKMVIYPNKVLPSVGMKFDTEGKQRYSDPTLKTMREIIKEAIPQCDLNEQQRKVFDSFFNSNKFLTRDE